MGGNARAKYRNHSYRRWCSGAVKASSSKTTFCLRVTGKVYIWAKYWNLYLVKVLAKYKNVSYWEGTAIGRGAGEAGYAPSSAYLARAPNNISLMAQWSTGWIKPC